MKNPTKPKKIPTTKGDLAMVLDRVTAFRFRMNGLSDKVTRLLSEFSIQFRKDNGAERESDKLEGVTDATEFSVEARKKLQTLLEFLEQHEA
jgi:hypothetical protein